MTIWGLFGDEVEDEDEVEEKLSQDYSGQTVIVDFDGSMENESEAIAVRLQCKDACWLTK